MPLKPQTLRINPRYAVCRITSPLAGVPLTQGITSSNRKPWFLDVSWQPVLKSIKTLGFSRSLSAFFLSLPPFLSFLLSSLSQEFREDLIAVKL